MYVLSWPKVLHTKTQINREVDVGKTTRELLVNNARICARGALVRVSAVSSNDFFNDAVDVVDEVANRGLR